MFQNRPRLWPLTQTNPLLHVRISRNVSRGSSTSHRHAPKCRFTSLEDQSQATPHRPIQRQCVNLPLCSSPALPARIFTGACRPFRSWTSAPKLTRPIASTRTSSVAGLSRRGSRTLNFLLADPCCRRVFHPRTPGRCRERIRHPTCFRPRGHGRAIQNTSVSLVILLHAAWFESFIAVGKFCRNGAQALASTAAIRITGFLAGAAESFHPVTSNGKTGPEF